MVPVVGSRAMVPAVGSKAMVPAVGSKAMVPLRETFAIRARRRIPRA
jgi:hypothetical protein